MYQKQVFQNPDSSKSVLQIVHDFQFVALNLGRSVYEFSPEDSDEKRREHIKFRLDRLKKRGYAGVVMSVDNLNYLQDDEALERMAWAIDHANSLGLRVWIYDEQYYPTGAAGGLTLKDHPEHESMAMCCVEKDVVVKHNSGPIRIMSPYGHSGLKYAFAEDESGNRQEVSQWTDPAGNLCWDAPQGKWHLWCFFMRPHYEGSRRWATGRATRRYPNVADKASIARFLEVTFEPYERILGDRLKNKVEAIFTDEPTLQKYLPYPKDQDPETFQTYFPSVSIFDKPDLQIPIYPFVPWPRNLEENFAARCGYAVHSVLPEIFSRDWTETGKVRRDLFETLGAMFDEAYNGQFLEKLAQHQLDYSGHHLYEEGFHMHPYMFGDLMRNLGRMDVPGCDLLHSDPAQVRHSVACKLASSAAHMYGKSHVMIEASNMCDADQTFSPERIQLAMAMEYALGVDTITSYYGEELFDESGYRRFADYTARLGELVDGGTHVSQTLVYYPYEQMAALSAVAMEPVPPQAMEMDGSLQRLTVELLKKQVDFDYVNQEKLLECRCENGHILTPGGENPTSIVFPPVPFVDDVVAQWIADALAAGVRVIIDGDRREVRGLEGMDVGFTSESGLPASWDLQVEGEPLLTVLHRRSDDQDVYLVVNTGNADISKEASIPVTAQTMLLLDFDQGTETEISARVDSGRSFFQLNLPAGQARGFAVLK